MSFADPRENLKKLLREGDFKGLLLASGALHGHFCPGLALGVKAGHTALSRLDFENSGMEELVAVVECNNCFVDGIQVTTGCSFGNNAMIYKDLGKTAVTVLSRKLKRAVRVAVKPNSWRDDPKTEKDKEAAELFRRVVREREQDPGLSRRMKELWTELSIETVEKPAEDLFTISDAAFALPSFAPIFDSARCSVCGEEFMETRGALLRGKPACLSCARADCGAVLGKGVTTLAGCAFRSSAQLE